MSLAEYKHYRELEKRVEARRKQLMSLRPTAVYGILEFPTDNPIDTYKLVEKTLRKEFPEWYKDETDVQP